MKFAAFWISQYNLAFRTADPAPIAVLSAPECPVCQEFISQTHQYRESGEHVQGDLWSVDDNYLEKFDNVASAVVITKIHQNPVRRVDKNGAPIATYKDRVSEMAFTLKHNGSAWQVLRLQVVE